MNFSKLIIFLLAIPVLVLVVAAQPFDPALYQELRWRSIGPFRAGRTVAISGIPSQPNVFYMAPNNGGVWKTTDAGRTWTPIFDDQPTGSIGALAIAPSNPDIIYVGSGEGLRRPDLSVGDGIYKSTDAGRTWQHVGLHDAQQIANIIVDPKDPNRPLSRLSDILMARMLSAAYSAPSTEARRGKKFSTKTRTPAPSTSSSIPATHKLFLPPCGPRAVLPGQPAAPTAALAADSTSPPMAAIPGARSPRAFQERLNA